MRIILLAFSLLSTAVNAQNYHKDAFEHVIIPEGDDFMEIFKFWKQLNAINTSELLKFDSVLFYKNDSLKYTYYIANLKSFQSAMNFTDSVLSARADSIYNKELNSVDTYFINIDNNRYLDNRKYLNNNGVYYKAAQFSPEGSIIIKTIWLFDKHNKIKSERTEYKEISLSHLMRYKHKKDIISQRHAYIKTKRFNLEYTTDYNESGRIIGFASSNSDRRPKHKITESVKVERSKDDLAKVVKGFSNNKAISFTFSYVQNTSQIDRKIENEKTTFKIVVF